jgi:hypothetical protein
MRANLFTAFLEPPFVFDRESGTPAASPSAACRTFPNAAAINKENPHETVVHP